MSETGFNGQNGGTPPDNSDHDSAATDMAQKSGVANTIATRNGAQVQSAREARETALPQSDGFRNRKNRIRPRAHAPAPGRPGGPGGPGAEKAKDFKASWKRLINYCGRFKLWIGIALIIASLSSVFQFISPNVTKDLINIITGGLPTVTDGQSIPNAIDMTALTNTALLLIVLFAISIVFSFTENFIMATVTARISKNMRTDVDKKINRLPLAYFDKTTYGDVISRITNDVDTIGQTLNQSLDSLIRAITAFIGSTCMMLYINRTMTFTAIGASLAGFVFMIIIMAISQKHFYAQQQGLGDINGHIEEIYSCHDVVKAYNGGAAAIKTFEEINGGLYESGWKSQFLSGLMMPLMSFIGSFGYVAVCVVGAALAMNDAISFGVIIAFAIYVRLFTQPLTQIAQSMQTLQRTAAAGERVFEFLEEKELSDESHKILRLDRIKGDVEFKNVRFGYETEKPIINDFSATVKAGQKIAIVGPTGAGKTTIVNLLMRFYEIQSGVICIDKVPTSDITRENLHDQFCMVLQDTWLFEGTIKENVIYAKKGVEDSEVETACKTAGIHHFIHTLPLGYETVLDDKASLSAGQKQLIAIARAMIQNSPLLILDEATSSVDTRTERRVQEAMEILTRGRTSFVIAHRLSTIKNADMIFVMNGGDIAESGKHAELLEKGGFYAELYNSQFETA